MSGIFPVVSCIPWGLICNIVGDIAEWLEHRVYRLSVQSSELDPPPPPPPQASVSPPHLGPGGRATLACGVGGGGPNSDEGTDTLVLFLYTIIPLRAGLTANAKVANSPGFKPSILRHS